MLDINIKKGLKISIIVTFVINIFCFLVNLICAYTINSLPFGILMNGGEANESIGFGVYLLKTFPIVSSEEVVKGSSKISFDIVSLLVPIILFFAIFMIIFITVNKIKKNK